MKHNPTTTQHQRSIILGVFLWFLGISFCMPFLPLYLQQIGRYDTGQAALWAGIAFALTPGLAAISAPIWGAIADRVGRRIMLQRSLLIFAVALALMGAATSPYQILILRGIMGLVGGFSSAAVALISTGVTDDRLTTLVGRIQSARLLGMGLGPLPGGILADLLGYRATCFATSLLGMLSLAIITRWTRADAGRGGWRRKQDGTRPDHPLIWRALVPALAVGFLARATERTFDPILPLFLSSLPSTSLGLATATAIVTSAGLIGAVAGAATASFQSRHFGPGRAVAGAIVLAGVAFAAVMAAWSVLVVAGLRVLIGVALGAAFTISIASIASDSPEERRSFVLGVSASVASVGGALGYLIGGALGSVSLEKVFAVDAILMVVALAAHGTGWWRRSRGRRLR